MTKVRVKECGPADIDRLMQWRMRVLREVFAGNDGADFEALERLNRSYYSSHLADGSHLAVLAYADGGEVLGCGGVCFQEELPSPDNPSGLCAYLMNIYVLPAHRRHAVGSAIVQFLIEESRRRGCGKIYLESTEKGRDMYRRLGFKPLGDYYIYRPCSEPV